MSLILYHSIAATNLIRLYESVRVTSAIENGTCDLYGCGPTTIIGSGSTAAQVRMSQEVGKYVHIARHKFVIVMDNGVMRRL